MKITTKGRYAILIMIILANHYDDGQFISLKEIAEEENISLKYLEKIMMSLKKEDFFNSSRGVDGGYKLAYPPNHYRLGDILKAAEREIAPASCVTDNVDCLKKGVCKTYPIWKDLNDEMMNYLNHKTLEDYMERK